MKIAKPSPRIPASEIPVGYEGPIPTEADRAAWLRWGNAPDGADDHAREEDE